LAELIWNGLDADATNINAEFSYLAGGMSKILVHDDGVGFARDVKHFVLERVERGGLNQDDHTGVGATLSAL
jgi:DNA mismatch repair ATPase MutL